MTYNTYHIQSFDCTKLLIHELYGENKAKTTIVLVHGIGEHGARFLHWGERFVKNGFAFVTYDQRGHGLSEGKQGFISSYNDLMNDIDAVLDVVHQKHPNSSVILYGHSMGGGEVLNHLLKRKSRYIGVIASSPWIVSQASPPGIFKPIFRLFSKIAPAFRIKMQFKPSLLSQDKQALEHYKADKLVHSFISFRLFAEADKAASDLLQANWKINKPILLIHGGKDRITSAKASRKFAEKNQKYCKFKLWNNGLHELHNEPFRNEVFASVLAWIHELQKKQKHDGSI